LVRRGKPNGISNESERFVAAMKRVMTVERRSLTSGMLEEYAQIGKFPTSERVSMRFSRDDFVEKLNRIGVEYLTRYWE
jgi:hypothetical protein